MRLTLCRSASVLGGIVGLAAVAQAQILAETATLGVTARVQTQCSLSGGTLDFGTYVANQGADLNVDGRIGYVNCSGALRFELDGGQSGDVENRYMTADGNRLRYQLYQTPARIKVWGEGGDELSLRLASTRSGTIPVYGVIEGGQLVPPGAYADIVNITLTF